MVQRFLLAGLFALSAYSQTAASLGKQVLTAGLDAARCYRVRDLQIQQADATYYLTDGYLIFGKAVKGAPLSAIFSADVEGGDAEVVLLPPDHAERRSLAAYTGSPNLDEHFTTAVFFFTEKAARGLAERVGGQPGMSADLSMGALMAERWAGTMNNLMASFESRIVLDLLAEPTGNGGFFEAVVRGRKRGDFDILHDSRAPEQMAVGQSVTRGNSVWWDSWASFADKVQGDAAAPAPEAAILGYRIEATLGDDLKLHCKTIMRIRTTERSRTVLPFDISGLMQATSAKIDGVSVEVYQRESVRNGMLRTSGNELVLVVPAQPLEPGSEHEVEIEHSGKVVVDTGHDVFYVISRGTWFPGRGIQFAPFDVTYRYPGNLNLVASGSITEDTREGGIHMTRRVTDKPARMIGFNLGRYDRRDVVSDGIRLGIAANREFEDGLRALPPAPVAVTSSRGVRTSQVFEAAAPPAPTAGLSAIADEIAAEVSFFRARFGEPALTQIEVSPVPGRFGQGFAGMIYLPTQTYLEVREVSAKTQQPQIDRAVFDTILRAHEVAHQWWGNVATAGSYHHEWLMEALANYSALLFVESRKGPAAVEMALDLYRRQLVEKSPNGAEVESEGPVVQGRRLEGSNNPNAVTAIVYGKGTWIIHMLRRRMGDERFLKMLAELRGRYERRAIDTEQFRELCAEFLPPNSADPKLTDFFDQWVYGTGIPSLKLRYTISGRKLNGTITQENAPEDFSVAIPVEIRSGQGKPVVKVVRTATGEVKFSADVTSPAAKAVLDPGWSVLKR